MTNLSKLERAWTEETAYKGEGIDGDPKGQCCVTALLVQDLEGGSIFKCKVGRVVPGAKHIREGIVIRSSPERYVRGAGRAQLKLVSNAFLEKEQRKINSEAEGKTKTKTKRSF